MNYIIKYSKKYDLFKLFLLCLFLIGIFVIYYLIKKKCNNQIKESFCDKNNKECVLYSNGDNTCCDNMYCVRKDGNFHNRVCSKDPEPVRKENEFISKISEFGDKIYKNIVIKDCDLEGEVKKNICNDGLFKIHVKCDKNEDKDKDIKFPETTLFSMIHDKECHNKR